MRYRRIQPTLRHDIASPEIINLIFGGKKTLHGSSQSHYPLIHLDGTGRSDLIIFKCAEC